MVQANNGKTRTRLSSLFFLQPTFASYFLFFFTIPCSNLDETREIRTLSVQLLFLFDRNPFFIEKNIYRLENCFYNIEFINEIIYLFENRFFIFFFFFSFFIRRGENINPLQ